MQKLFVVKMREADPRFHLEKGDVLIVTPYELDPEKKTVVKRIADDFDPGCNLYNHQYVMVGMLTLPPSCFKQKR